MRRVLAFFMAFLLMSSSSVLAGWVNHYSQSGVVATMMYANPDPGYVFMLKSTGEVWRLQPWTLEWDYFEYFTPPVPVSEVEWWDVWTVITKSGDVWRNAATEWFLVGQIPTSAAAQSSNGQLAEATILSCPNPTPDYCRISFRLPSASSVSINITDVTGRAVRRLFNGLHPGGDYSLVWDGKDDNGRTVPAGVYLTRVQMGDEVSTGRVVLAR
jgi:hypothetical protein